jgi:hypothetical protein
MNVRWKLATDDALTTMAQAFLDRAAVAGWDNAAKTKAAIEYFTGAYVALRTLDAGSDLARRIQAHVSMMQFVMGWREVERMAKTQTPAG